MNICKSEDQGGFLKNPLEFQRQEEIFLQEILHSYVATVYQIGAVLLLVC